MKLDGVMFKDAGKQQLQEYGRGKKQQIGPQEGQEAHGQEEAPQKSPVGAAEDPAQHLHRLREDGREDLAGAVAEMAVEGAELMINAPFAESGELRVAGRIPCGTL